VNLTPDEIMIFKIGIVEVNATIFYTWVVMLLIIGVSLLAGMSISIRDERRISRLQNALEIIVSTVRSQIHDITGQKPAQYIPFLGCLFLFISLSNFLAFIPIYHAPTGSLNTTAALAICVFVAVPFYGIKESGITAYLKHYFQPVIFMFPFNIISELSRTLALAVRLFGNVMSGSLITAILLSIVPFFIPLVMDLFSLLIGQIHAYIFAVLATVYIASGIQTQEETQKKNTKQKAQ